MEKHTLVSRRAVPNARPSGAGESPAAKVRDSFAEIFGTLQDTVTIAPGTDLTDPVDEDWDAAR